MKNKILVFTATYNEAENIIDFLNCVEKRLILLQNQKDPDLSQTPSIQEQDKN